MKRLQIQRRMNTAAAAYALGRPETDDERAEREDRERRTAAAKELQRLCDRSPMGVYFPGDTTLRRKPSFDFVTAFLREED